MIIIGETHLRYEEPHELHGRDVPEPRAALLDLLPQPSIHQLRQQTSEGGGAT